ncbi:hypothetical protein EIG74_13910 [Escherichia coli O10]|nr:hypothetical protein [Escherichia coli O10]
MFACFSGVTGYRYGYIECCECFRNLEEMANEALKIWMLCVIKRQTGDGVTTPSLYRERKIRGCRCSASVNSAVNEAGV